MLQKGLHWLNIPANQTSYDFGHVKEVDESELQFAISVEYMLSDEELLASSGLKWSVCTYDLYKGN